MSKQVFLLISVLVVLTGCGQNATPQTLATTPAPQTQGAENNQTPGVAAALQPVLAKSELVVGRNRLALELLSDNVPISDAPQTTVKVLYYKIVGAQATLVGDEGARIRSCGHHRFTGSTHEVPDDGTGCRPPNDFI